MLLNRCFKKIKKSYIPVGIQNWPFLKARQWHGNLVRVYHSFIWKWQISNNLNDKYHIKIEKSNKVMRFAPFKTPRWRFSAHLLWVMKCTITGGYFTWLRAESVLQNTSLFLEIQPVSIFSAFPILIGNTADQSKRGRTKMASKQLQNRKKTVSEHFSLSSGSDSSLVSLTNEPDFLGKRAVP